MPLKLNISEKGKSWKLELESEALVGKSLSDKIQGSELSPDLAGYELEITGATDNAGFPHKSDVSGQALKRVLLTKGWGMHKKPRKEGKKRVSTPKGLRLRKTVRGKELSEKTIQVNLTVLKSGNKLLKEIYPEQNKPKEEPKKETSTEKPTPETAEQPKSQENPKSEDKPTEIKKEIKSEEKPTEQITPAQ